PAMAQNVRDSSPASVLSFSGEALFNCLGQGILTSFGETCHHSRPVRNGAVLAHFPLTLESRDRNLETNNRPKLPLHMGGRCIANPPWRTELVLMLLCQSFEKSS